eukprot:1334987-Pleurochrysis_carterae.AAC.1
MAAPKAATFRRMDSSAQRPGIELSEVWSWRLSVGGCRIDQRRVLVTWRVPVRDRIALGALCVRFGAWVLCCDARTLASDVGVDFR